MKHNRKISSLFLGKAKKVPYIRLSGQWLDDFGFKIGDEYRINVTPDSIILRAKRKEGTANEIHTSV